MIALLWMFDWPIILIPPLDGIFVATILGELANERATSLVTACFVVEEALDELGEGLALPPFLKAKRAEGDAKNLKPLA